MQEIIFMECLIQNGKTNTKNNYFSFNRGNSSTKLQGLLLTFNWSFKIPSHASVTPPDDPGKAKIYLPFAKTAQALDCIAEVPTVFRLIVLKTSPKPGIFLSAISSIASGVMSLPVKPVPPVVITTSISFLLIHSFKIKTISSLLSLQIFLSTKLWLASLIFLTRMAPDLSLSKVLVSVTVNKAIFTIRINFWIWLYYQYFFL